MILDIWITLGFLILWVSLFLVELLSFYKQANEIELTNRMRSGEMEQLELEMKKLKFEQVAGKHWNS